MPLLAWTTWLAHTVTQLISVVDVVETNSLLTYQTVVSFVPIRTFSSESYLNRAPLSFARSIRDPGISLADSGSFRDRRANDRLKILRLAFPTSPHFALIRALCDSLLATCTVKPIL